MSYLLRIIQHLVSYMANPSFGPKQCFFSATIIRFHEFKEKRKIILDLCADCAPVLMACEAHDRLLSEIDFDSSPVSAFWINGWIIILYGPACRHIAKQTTQRTVVENDMLSSERFYIYSRDKGKVIKNPKKNKQQNSLPFTLEAFRTTALSHSQLN